MRELSQSQYIADRQHELIEFGRAVSIDRGIPACDCQSSVTYTCGKTKKKYTQHFAGSYFAVEKTKDGRCTLCGYYVTHITRAQLDHIQYCRDVQSAVAKVRRKRV